MVNRKDHYLMIVVVTDLSHLREPGVAAGQENRFEGPHWQAASSAAYCRRTVIQASRTITSVYQIVCVISWL